MSDLSITLIIIYAIVNMIWTIWMPYWLADRFDTDRVDIMFPTYVQCSDAADEHNINVVGKWVMTLVYTIFILPGLLIYYLTIGVSTLSILIFQGLLELLSNMFREE